MGKTKEAATGKGYLGEIMVHRITGEMGVVENVVEAHTGWPPQLTVRLQNGSVKRGNLGDFRDASAAQKKKFSANSPLPPAAAPSAPAAAQEGASGSGQTP
ncbi:MAG: hypothetical protein JXQ71_17290 [Verrucomicrobia bacterium]|nr:hypothetical protein [Verrucomicrobiota bacterium]